MQNSKFKMQNSNQGFTLIEMLVSTAIFTIVMVIALGALLSVSESDRRAEALKAVINNLNFSLESISRTTRTGTVYHCGSGTLTNPQDCTGLAPDNNPPASALSFLAADGVTQVVYCLGTVPAVGSPACDQSGTYILRSTNGGGSYLPITASEVVITNLLFFVKGSTPGSPDNTQPKVTMLINGKVMVGGSASSVFNLETSVTQRVYDQ